MFYRDKTNLFIVALFMGIIATSFVYWHNLSGLEAGDYLLAPNINQQLMAEALINHNPDIMTDSYFTPDYYKIYQEIPSPDQSRTAVLFGLDADKTGHCCFNPSGIFINDQNNLAPDYYIRDNALDAFAIENVNWQDNDRITYDQVVYESDEALTTNNTLKIK